MTDEEKPRSNRTILDIGCFRWLINIRVGYLVFRVKNRCYIEPYLPCRFARQFGYDQLYVGNPSRCLKVEGGLVDGVRAWLWTMAGCTEARFALPSYKRKPMITFLSCKWLLSAYEFIGVKSLSELESDYLVRAAMMAARKAEIARKQGKRRGKSSLNDEVETPEGEFADIDSDQGELGAGLSYPLTSFLESIWYLWMLSFQVEPLAITSHVLLILRAQGLEIELLRLVSLCMVNLWVP